MFFSEIGEGIVVAIIILMKAILENALKFIVEFSFFLLHIPAEGPSNRLRGRLFKGCFCSPNPQLFRLRVGMLVAAPKLLSVKWFSWDFPPFCLPH